MIPPASDPRKPKRNWDDYDSKLNNPCGELLANTCLPNLEHRRNYYRFCAGFGLSVSPSLCCLIYSPAALSDRAGGLGNCILFFAYALSALLLAKPLTAVLGAKRGLLAACAGKTRAQ